VAGLAAVLLRRTGYRRPMAAGTVVSAAGLVVMAASPWGMSAYLWLALSAAIIGIGLGTAMPATNNAMLQLAPESAASIAGLRGMFRQAGGITGVSVISAILARSSDPGIAQAQVFVVLAVMLMAMLPLLRVIPEHRGAW
jgi:MFS family permease